MDTNEGTKLARQGFKQFNRFMLLLWRLGLGSWVNIWPEVGGQILVLTHKGRKSGALRRTPVNYAVVDGEYYCVAGFGPFADWYRNLVANPGAEVWLPDGWWQATAEEITGSEFRLALVRAVLIGSGFASLLAGIDPHKVSDEELDRMTKDYRLVRLHLITPRTGPGGPGDLAWVWPLATLLLLALRPRRKKRGCRCC
ncbi:MAG TPA: nitroreductase family deazaflavin-dependent oxidoreductase [Anaerolineaceae bacterium]